MLGICERLRQPDRERQNHGPYRAETGYLRALVDAMADMDRWAEVELLKTLGDLNLELGELDRDAVKFARAMKLYMTAQVRCTDPEVGLTLEHRHKYTEKLATRRRVKHPTYIVKGTGTSSPSNLAERFEELDKKLASGHNIDAVMVGYTRLMVEGIIAGDSMLEGEAIKSLGDVFLKRGRETRDTTCLTKASALYHTALARWEGGQGRAVLLHRLLYTAKVRQHVNTTLTKSKKRNKAEDNMYRRQHDFQLPRDILASHRDADGTTRETRRLYSGYLRIADHILRSGHLDFAEEVFSFALRLIHDPSKPALSNEADCLSRLGDVYTKKGQSTKEGKKFTQAAALYNAAIARTDDPGNRQNLVKKLQEVERLFLQHVIGVDSQVSLCNNTQAHREQLQSVRAYAKSKLEVIDEKYNPYQYDENDPVVREVEVQRAEAIQKLFKYISRERRGFVQGLLEECMEKLGSPPCKYAYIGLGSQATELVTPYSDLEFAILMEEGKDDDDTRRHFLNLTHYLHLKVINLGETILPAMAIASLNDFYSEDPEKDWFYDSVTRRGFAFDGFMPWACKTPFGREQTKSKPALSLIQTPTKMAEFQRQDVSLADGYHLSTVLRRAVLLMGDQDLVDEYTRNLEDSTATSPDFSSSTLSMLKRSIGETGDRLPRKELLDVKKEIYRLPSLAIDLLRVVCGNTSASVWKALEEMERNGQISSENANHLKVLTSISAELRLRTYLSNEGQREQVSVLPEMKSQLKGQDIPHAVIDKVFHISDTKMLFRYYYTAIPLKECILDVFDNSSQAQMAAFSERVIFDNSHFLRGLIAHKLHQYQVSTISLEAALETVTGDQEMYVPILIALADNCMSCNDYKGVLKHSERCLKISKDIYGENTPNVWIAMSLHNLGVSWSELGDQRKAMNYLQQSHTLTERLYGVGAATHDTASLYYDLGICWDGLGNTKEAIKCHEQSLKIFRAIYGDKAARPCIARPLNCLGQCWSKRGDDRKAIKYFEQSLRLDRAMCGYNTVHPSIAMSIHNLGVCWSSLGEYMKASCLFKQSLEMLKVMYGYNAVRSEFAVVLNSIGSCCTKLGELRTAINYHEQALNMGRAIYGDAKGHSLIAGSLNNLGTAWSELGDVKKAISYLEQSVMMLKEMHGDNTPHPDTASSLNDLGTAYEDMGNSMEAISCLEQSLRMKKAICGENTPHPEIAMSLNNLGSSWIHLGNERKAIRYYEESLWMTKAIYGDKTAHPHIASSLSNIGSAWQKLGDYKKAITYYEQSLEMETAMYGKNTPHPIIAKTLNNLGTVWRKLSQYRKAVSCHESSLSMGKAFYGDNTPHPDTASSLYNIGNCRVELGEEREAIRCHEQSLSMLKAVYGEKTPHPLIASALRNLGSCFSELGDQRKAIEYHEDSLTIYKVVYGEKTPHPDIAKSLGHLGECWSKHGDLGKAIGYFEQSLKMRKSIYGDNTDHPDIANSLNSIGGYWSRVGDKKKAIRYIEESLEMYKRIHGDNTAHSDIARSLQNLGLSWNELRDYKKAAGYLQESLKLYKAVYGENTVHLVIAQACGNLAVSLDGLGEHSKAVSYHEQSLRMHKLIYGEQSTHLDIAVTLKNLGTSCGILGDLRRAINCFEQALAMMKDAYGPNTSNPNIALLLYNLAFSWSNLGDNGKARNYLEQAKRMIQNVDREDTVDSEFAQLLRDLSEHLTVT